MVRVLAWAIIACFLVDERPAVACTCMSLPQTAEHAKSMLDNSEVVFVGRVELITPAGTGSGSYGIGDSLVVVEVLEAIKGVDASSTVDIYWERVMCGNGFESGDTYLIFLYSSDPNGLLTSSSCGAYKYLTNRRDEQKYADHRKQSISKALALLREVNK